MGVKSAPNVLSNSLSIQILRRFVHVFFQYRLNFTREAFKLVSSMAEGEYADPLVGYIILYHSRIIREAS